MTRPAALTRREFTAYSEAMRQVFATHDCWHDTDPQAPAAVREGSTNACRRCGAAGHKLYLRRCGDG